MPSESKDLYLKYPYGRYDSDGFTVNNFTGDVVTRNRSRTWVRTTGFRMRNKWKQELPMTPYTDQIIERKLNQSIVRMKRVDIPTSPLQTHYGIFAFEDCPQVTLPHPDHTELMNKAIGKIPTRINGTQFNLPLFMAEWRKTASMVTDLAHDIANKMKNTRSRRELQNMWLEYRYGWRLLVRDIYDALCALHDTRLNRSVMEVKARATKLYDLPLVTRGELQGTRYMLSGYKTSYTLKQDWLLGLDLCIRFRERSSALGTLQQFGITNPIGLVWELIPYSFVLDWLIPVSDYLTGLDTWVGKDFVSGTVCYWCDVKHASKPFGFRDPLQPALVEQAGSVYAVSETHRRFFKREVLLGFPSMSPPEVQLNLNTSRMVDAVSLMLQRARHPSSPSSNAPENPFGGLHKITTQGWSRRY